MTGPAVGDQDLAMPHDGTEATLDDATADAVRRVVASHSENADECAMFLAMLGVGTGAGCKKCGGEMRQHKGGLAARRVGGGGICYTCRTSTAKTKPVRECGHVDDGTEACGKCSMTVAADEVRAVVARIRDATGITPTQIAQLAEIHPVARLTAIAYRGSEQKTAKREILDAVIDVELKIAMGDLVPQTPAQVAESVACHIDKLVAAKWTVVGISREAQVSAAFVGRFTEPSGKRPKRINPDAAQRVLAIPIGPPVRASRSPVAAGT